MKMNQWKEAGNVGRVKLPFIWEQIMAFAAEFPYPSTLCLISASVAVAAAVVPYTISGEAKDFI
jgi:hypothetical protein